MKKTYKDLVNEILPRIQELFPWDLQENLVQGGQALLVDISEPGEYARAHIPDSINVPRGILESACDYDYDETVPELAQSRDTEIVLICRSGNRSALAAYTLQQMGFTNVASLKTGLRGWNDYDCPLVDSENRPVDPDTADEYFTTRLRPEQRTPQTPREA
jgi:rhodanese-related sulfurtransferase